MKKLATISLICCLLLPFEKSVIAQTAVIPDANFRACLKNNYPNLLDANDELIISEAQNFNDTLECVNNDIFYIDGMEHFINLKGLKFQNNEIVDITPIAGLTQIEVINLTSNELEIIPDLTNFTQLTRFYANYNQMDNLPVLPNSMEVIHAGNNSLAGTVDFSNFPNLKSLSVFENDYKVFKGLENKTQLSYFEIRDNKLSDLPDLSASVNLTYADISLNKFTFEDILPFADLAIFPTSVPNYDQQTAPETNETIDITEDETWTWTLSFDQDVSNNTYSWYKDNQFIGTTTTGELKITSVELQDAGVYHCEVVNSHPKLSGMKIVTNSKTLNVLPSNCFKLVSVAISQNTAPCEEESQVTLSAQTQREVQGDLRYFLVAENSLTDTISSNNGSFVLKEEGLYNIVVKDDVCSKTAQEEVSVEFNLDACAQEEPYSFSPNGDGNEDAFYIDKSGTAKIYNKRGELVKELHVPAQWDGTDSNKQLLDFGLYIIIINGREKMSVTLMR